MPAVFYIMKTEIYLSIGSNMGDRRRFISEALEHLRRLGEIIVSDEYANEADGFVSVNSFINIAAILTIESDTSLTATDAIVLLHKLKAIEQEISYIKHRNSDGSYRDREIDIDIIAIEGLKMNSAELTLPHPRAASRAFVTIPLMQLIGGDAAHRLFNQ